LGSFEHTVVTEGKAQLFWTLAPFLLSRLQQPHSTQVCEAGQEVKKKVRKKNQTPNPNLPKIEISVHKDAWGQEIL